MRILAENTLALVVDFQDKLIPVIKGNSQLLHNTQILLKGLKLLQIPMIVTQQYTKGLGMTIPSLMETMGEDKVFYDKITFSCADDEKILEQIEKRGKTNIIICGAEAHICVLQSVIDLLEKGFCVVLIEDCIGSRKESDKKTALCRAVSEGAVIASYESILFELTRTAKSEVFKQISALIK